jgi:diguanylate cyclase (GGDEF)-like protein/PAS domain S-box-containing protein
LTQGLSETDLRALATLLEGFGVSLGLAGDDRRVQSLAAGFAASGSAPRLASMVMTDGRRLVVSGREHRVPAGTPPAPAAPVAPNPSPPQAAVPSPFVAERRAGADTADMRFRLLAEHSIDLIVAVDADLAIRYASPATAGLLGCAPNDLHGHTLAELLAPEDRAAFIARHFTKAAQRGQVPDLFRALRRDGSTLWVEARVASLPPGNGLGDYLVTFRDADQRRRAEDALGRLNAELSTLASTDALTGLPNRRQFDATLHKEWYRALRDATPLGLLMIDVDRFKPLNDRFGHPVGDRFLALVGQVIRDNVRRASDMAARYGGEEFAVVLPGTGAAGALEIAEVIRRAVAAADTRGIVEGGYPLSVSIGVAATVALAGGGSASLVHSADSALYQAKRNGRNRVEILQ